MDIQEIKKLREETGAGVLDCQKALSEAKGDLKKAKEILKEKGFDKATKKEERPTGCGLIDSYAHFGKIGVLIEVACETDFVARTKEFKNFVHDLCLQIAGMAPKNEKELLSQPFIKDESKTVEELLKEKIAQFGENIKIKRFLRWEL